MCLPAGPGPAGVCLHPPACRIDERSRLRLTPGDDHRAAGHGPALGFVRLV